jgi:hypothetical protein
MGRKPCLLSQQALPPRSLICFNAVQYTERRFIANFSQSRLSFPTLALSGRHTSPFGSFRGSTRRGLGISLAIVKRIVITTAGLLM